MEKMSTDTLIVTLFHEYKALGGFFKKDARQQNGQPSYTKVGDETVKLWCTIGSRWMIGGIYFFQRNLPHGLLRSDMTLEPPTGVSKWEFYCLVTNRWITTTTNIRIAEGGTAPRVCPPTCRNVVVTNFKDFGACQSPNGVYSISGYCFWRPQYTLVRSSENNVHCYHIYYNRHCCWTLAGSDRSYYVLTEPGTESPLGTMRHLFDVTKRERGSISVLPKSEYAGFAMPLIRNESFIKVPVQLSSYPNQHHTLAMKLWQRETLLAMLIVWNRLDTFSRGRREQFGSMTVWVLGMERPPIEVWCHILTFLRMEDVGRAKNNLKPAALDLTLNLAQAQHETALLKRVSSVAFSKLLDENLHLKVQVDTLVKVVGKIASLVPGATGEIESLISPDLPEINAFTDTDKQWPDLFL